MNKIKRIHVIISVVIITLMEGEKNLVRGARIKVANISFECYDIIFWLRDFEQRTHCTLRTLSTANVYGLLCFFIDSSLWRFCDLEVFFRFVLLVFI